METTYRKVRLSKLSFKFPNYIGNLLFVICVNLTGSIQSKSINRLYDISAPDADILSDVDAFGLYNAYKYFIAGNLSLPGSKPAKLSSLLEYFYDPAYNSNNTTLYPIDANYRRRWLNFCKKVDTVTTTDVNNKPEYFFSQYQGFIEYTGPMPANPSAPDLQNYNNWTWVADMATSPNHISIETLRRRGEVYAAFWYQFKIGGGYILKFLFDRDKNLDPGREGKENRFERHFSNPPYTDGNIIYKTIQGDYSTILTNNTKPDELTYLISKFITSVKTAFEIEKANQ